MGEWKETNLGKICSNISYGYTASAKQDAIGPKFLRITDIVPDRINWQTVPFCEADAPTIEKYKLKNGDIVIARTGATTGYNKIIKNIEFNAVFASYLIRYKIDKEKAYPYYIGHVLQSSNWYDYVDAIAGGSAQPGANAKELASFDILLPPLPEQKAIASVLSSLDDKIDLLHRQNKTLEAMAETLFRQWFVVEAQEDWEGGALGDFVNIAYGKNLPTKNLQNNGYPVFGGNGQIGFFEKYLYEKPQVLVSCRGEASGVVNISLPKSFVTNNSLILEINKRREITFEYLKYVALNTDFKMYVSGSAQPQITINGLYDADFMLPDKETIDRFSEVVGSWESKRTNNQSQICTLEKLRDTLLPKLMSGEVRVKT